MRYVFIINPVAGKGKVQEKIAEKIDLCFRKNGGDYAVYHTRCRDDAGNIASKEASKGDEVCIFACGGEGTSFEVVNGVYGHDNATVGVIPCGSANDFLKYFDDKDRFLDIENQIRGTKVKMDLIKVGDKYCLNGCSVGMDAMVANDMRLFKRIPFVSGSMAYKLSIVKTFMKKLGVKIDVIIDGENIGESNCLFAVIANAPYYGGGFMGAPDAVPNDGKLDFTMIDVISKARIPKFLSLYKKGNHRDLDYCKMCCCKKVEISASCPVPINMDGEIVFSDKITFEVVRSAVNFLVPYSISQKILINV